MGKQVEEVASTLYLVTPKRQEAVFKSNLQTRRSFCNILAKAILSGKLEFDFQKKILNIEYPENRECIEEGCTRLARHGRFANLLMCRKCYHENKLSDTLNAAEYCKICGRYYYWDDNGVCPCKK